MNASHSVTHVPVIDLATSDRDAVAARLDAAASEFGFFYVTGHGIDPALVRSVLELSRSFFARPEDEKSRIHMSSGGRAWRGYFPVGGELTSGRPDLKEGIYLGEELSEDDTRVRAGLPLHGRNLFPGVPGFREAIL